MRGDTHMEHTTDDVTVTVELDDSPSSPLESMTTLGTLVTMEWRGWHGVTPVTAGGDGVAEYDGAAELRSLAARCWERFDDAGDCWRLMQRYLRVVRGLESVLVFGGDNGIATDSWSTSQVYGLMVALPAALEATGVENDWLAVEEALRVEVEQEAAYRRGEVWSWSVRDDVTGDLVDGCGGYYSVTEAEDDASDALTSYVDSAELAAARERYAVEVAQVQAASDAVAAARHAVRVERVAAMLVKV